MGAEPHKSSPHNCACASRFMPHQMIGLRSKEPGKSCRRGWGHLSFQNERQSRQQCPQLSTPQTRQQLAQQRSQNGPPALFVEAKVPVYPAFAAGLKWGCTVQVTHSEFRTVHIQSTWSHKETLPVSASLDPASLTLHSSLATVTLSSPWIALAQGHTVDGDIEV